VDTVEFCVNARVSVSIHFYSTAEIIFLAYVLNLTHLLGTTPEPGYQCVNKKLGRCSYYPWFSAVFKATVLPKFAKKKGKLFLMIGHAITVIVT